jgi:hypothetical protein
MLRLTLRIALSIVRNEQERLLAKTYKGQMSGEVFIYTGWCTEQPFSV